MILAAGLGTRLRPLTDRVPKALVEVGGRPMLQRVAERLVAAGADRLVVNLHHHAEAVESFLGDWSPEGVEVRISREEPEILETGGGLKHAARHLGRDAPFFLHNVDVVSTIDLGSLYAAHEATRPLATLAVSGRETDRPLLFDEQGLFGHGGRDGTVRRIREPVGPTRAVGFCGIHVLEPAILDLMDEEGRFSIVPVYMRLAAAGLRIAPWDIGDALWVDVGTHERLETARRIVEP
jgi:NDP-sugar pyrophosphorylase family protein